MNPSQALAVLTIVLAIPLTWVVAYFLWRVSLRERDLSILRERAITATAVAGLVTVFGLIFVNNDQPIPPLSTDLTKIITRSTVLIAALITSVYWIALYLRRAR